MKTLLIDNYDSYTYNLYQLIAEISGELPMVIYNDQYTWDEVKEFSFDNVIISPGPGTPSNKDDFGVCRDVIENSNVPILGVCLGHQGIADTFGAKVVHAPEAMHGRISKVLHNNSGLFSGIPQEFNVVRYHSLTVDENSLPACLEKTAWTSDGVIMGLRHVERPIWGVQFHPESICTDYGKNILKNFLDILK
ncbi:MAG: aminodeoxychorismate/anthranilate synthase component II [Clostridium sp.]|nr:aminodeoxychorismate/anthranilate synthase component II [Clostridium sp.]